LTVVAFIASSGAHTNDIGSKAFRTPTEHRRAARTHCPPSPWYFQNSPSGPAITGTTTILAT